MRTLTSVVVGLGGAGIRSSLGNLREAVPCDSRGLGNVARPARSSLVVLLAFACACGGPRPAATASTSAPASSPSAAVRFIAGGDSRNDVSHVLPWAFQEAKARG